MPKNNQQNKTALIIGIVVVIIIVAAGGWYLTSKQSATTTASSVATTTPARRYGNGAMRGGFTTGSIEVLNNNGFTLTLADGSTKDVDITATTTLQNFASASSTPTTITPDQLSVGEQVQVIGTTTADGSIDARAVRTGTFPTGFGGGNRGEGSGARGPRPTQPAVQ